MEFRRTHCEKFLTDEKGDVIGVVEKRKYKSLEKAKIAADEQNVMNSRNQKLNPYKCSICLSFHVGRTGENITDDDVDAIFERRIERKYKVPTFKIIGKVDLSKIPLSNKDRRRIEKEKRKEKIKKGEN